MRIRKVQLKQHCSHSQYALGASATVLGLPLEVCIGYSCLSVKPTGGI